MAAGRSALAAGHEVLNLPSDRLPYAAVYEDRSG